MKKRILSIILIFLFGLFISGCGKKTTIIEPDNGLSFHTDLQQAYLNDSYTNFSLYAKGLENLSTPKAIEISWDDSVIEVSSNYEVKLSEYEDLSNPKTYTTNTNSISIYNLKIGTKYYYTVSSENSVSEVMSFETSSRGPRNLNIDELTNVRDLGGWKTDTSRVKQDLIFRSSKFNEDESTELIITQKGIEILVNEFKIKTEIDLRKTDDNENGGITVSPLGESVNYISMPMKSSGNILTLNKKQIVNILRVFADENNYPIIFHCSIGTDRTGLIAFLINALVGVSEDDLYRDYLFSNFGLIHSMRTPSAIKDYLREINLKSGATLKEKTYKYLLGLGMTNNELDNIIRILTK